MGKQFGLLIVTDSATTSVWMVGNLIQMLESFTLRIGLEGDSVARVNLMNHINRGI